MLYLGGLRWWPGVVIGDLVASEGGSPLAVELVITARQHRRGGGRHRPSLAPGRPARRARPTGPDRLDAAGDRARDGDQRDRRFDNAADRRHDRRRRSRENLAHDLDRRLDRRDRRAAVDPRLGSCVADRAPCGTGPAESEAGVGGGGDADGGHRPERALPVDPAASLLSGVSGPDLGGRALWPARGDARGLLRGGHGGVAHREQRRAVRAAFDHAERPQHTALRSGRGTDDAVPRCNRERTPAFGRGARRVQTTRDGTRRRGAPADRA